MDLTLIIGLFLMAIVRNRKFKMSQFKSFNTGKPPALRASSSAVARWFQFGVKMKKLITGCIPKNTECPFKDRCSPKIVCGHQGVQHKCDFSCGLARAFDLADNPQHVGARE